MNASPSGKRPKAWWIALALLTACGGGAPNLLTLQISKVGAGTGRVSSEPAAIACGEDCTAKLVSGSSLVLTAKADAGSVLLGWGGACSGNAGTCTLLVAADQVVTVSFGKSGPVKLPGGGETSP
jgi:hypothetical protein